MSISRKFEKPFLAILVLALVLLEAVILDAFLPYRWQHTIQKRIDGVFAQEPYKPHPDMRREIESDLEEHPWHRGILYFASSILALGNAYLIVKASRAMAHSKSRVTRSSFLNRSNRLYKKNEIL